MGILSAIKAFVRFVYIPILYATGFFSMAYTVFKDVRLGYFLLVFLIPQPNVWHKFYEYPLGSNILDILFICIVIGVIREGSDRFAARNVPLVITAILVTYFSLWNSSTRFNLPFPVTSASDLLKEWKNYAQMLLLYVIASNVVRKEGDQKKMILIVSLVVLFVAVRCFRNFSGGEIFNYSRRVTGPFEAVGLGPNHLGAFMAHCSALFLGLLLYEKDRRIQLLYAVTLLFSVHPILFSYSRGAYLGVLVSLVFLGVVKKRMILAGLVVLIVMWNTALPPSVVDRIQMTRQADGTIENSAGGRLDLWGLAYAIFKESPIIGVGYDGYAMSVGGARVADGQTIQEGQDVHSIYMRILSEQGIIGFSVFLLLLFRAVSSGRTLLITATTTFHKGLALGFITSVIALVVTNMFGDRWSYFVLGGYFWLTWGAVDAAILQLERTDRAMIEA